MKDTMENQMSNIYGNTIHAVETTQIASDDIYADVDTCELRAVPIEMNQASDSEEFLLSACWQRLPKENTKRWLVIALVVLLVVVFLLWVILISIVITYFLHLTESHENLIAEIQQLKAADIKLPCPSTWKQIQSNCYYISTTFLTWREAKDDCIDRQGQLLILRDQTEANALTTLLSRRPYWIGLKRTNNTWTWLDGTNPSFKSWGPSEPNNINWIEDCVELKGGLWNDVTCTHKIEYVCKSSRHY